MNIIDNMIMQGPNYVCCINIITNLHPYYAVTQNYINLMLVLTQE